MSVKLSEKKTTIGQAGRSLHSSSVVDDVASMSSVNMDSNAENNLDTLVCRVCNVTFSSDEDRLIECELCENVKNGNVLIVPSYLCPNRNY